MNVLIAIDKFKGCATSLQLAGAIRDAILERDPMATVTAIPIADGGDGTLDALDFILGNKVKSRKVIVKGPLPHLPSVNARYLLNKDAGEAYVELASASGLALVPRSERDVMLASTASTGVVLAHAINSGARHIFLGLGGSATTDCGMGILWALGVRFLDAKGNSLEPCGENMLHVCKVDTSRLSAAVKSTRFTLLTDVNNPLYGDNGAAQVFAPQKGATSAQVRLLDKGLKVMARLMPSHVPLMAGAGAAGGVAAGMVAFLNAEIKPGAQALLGLARFDDLLNDAQLVITGEGVIDSQTAMGKAAWAVLNKAHNRGVLVVAICGSVEPGLNVAQLGFDKVIAVTPQSMPLEQAVNTATALALVKDAVKEMEINEIKRMF